MLEPLPSRDLIRKVYDLTAPLYPLSSRAFHSRGHARLLELAGDIDGRQVLEVATGSGEMFCKLAAANSRGLTAGVDLSPAMVAQVRRAAGPGYPLQACNARALPFREATFDVVVCCYLFELLPDDALEPAAAELLRVLRPRGRALFCSVSQRYAGFNALYRLGAAAIPMFFGRQIASRMPEVLERQGFRVVARETLRQTGYPTDLTVAERV